MDALQDRIRGSLIGGAIGDALGYPVEFVHNFKAIQHLYGERAITRLDTSQRWLLSEGQTGKAVISDDTQMTLFTANGLLNAKRLSWPYVAGIRNAYLEWFHTQTGEKPNHGYDCWIASIPELNEQRAPGNTSMTALNAINKGRTPYNDSKGCGDMMRVAHQMGYDYDQTMAELRRLFKDCPKSTYRRIPETEEQCRFIAKYIKNNCN